MEDSLIINQLGKTPLTYDAVSLDPLGNAGGINIDVMILRSFCAVLVADHARSSKGRQLPAEHLVTSRWWLQLSRAFPTYPKFLIAGRVGTQTHQRIGAGISSMSTVTSSWEALLSRHRHLYDKGVLRSVAAVEPSNLSSMSFADGVVGAHLHRLG
jgi:TctA family transporter